jgi:hypothetical protein
MDSDFLTTALGGGDSSALSTDVPMAPPGGASPNVPAPQNTDPGQAPDIGSAQPQAVIPTQNSAPAAPAGTPSVWKDILFGALNGMAAGSQVRGGGAGAALAGIGAGAAGAIQAKQQQVAQRQAAQFQSLQAAHMMAETSARVHEDERATQEFREREADRQQNIADYLQANGFKPGSSFSADNPQDFHSNAVGALSVLASQNGGTIPPTLVVHQPIGTGQNTDTHDVAAFPITAQSVANARTGNVNHADGAMNIVNAYLTASRGYGLSHDEWESGIGATAVKAANTPASGTEYLAQQGKARQALVANALNYFQRPTLPKTEAGKIDAGAVASMSAQFQQELDNYSKRNDANPTIVNLLQNKVDSFNELSADALDRQGKWESQQIQNISGAQAQAAAAKVVAENTGQAGDAKANAQAREARIQQAVKNGDPSDAGKMLADRVTTISELKSRGMTPQYITQAVGAAQKYDPNYNPVVEDNNAKIASSPSNNQFFGSVNSLVAPGGTLDQLKDAGGKLSQNDLQILNKTKNWAALQGGQGGISAYAAKAVGVADDYAKVMGGGVGSDKSRDLVLHIIDPSLSPEQRSQAIEAVRDTANSQKESRIGNNSFLRKMYSTMPAPSTSNSNQQPRGGSNFFAQHGGQVTN